MDTHATSSVVLHCSTYRDTTYSMHCTTLLVMLLLVLSVSLAGSHDHALAGSHLLLVLLYILWVILVVILLPVTTSHAICTMSIPCIACTVYLSA